MERPTPRIDSAQMRDYMGEIVRMVGRVVQVRLTVCSVKRRRVLIVGTHAVSLLLSCNHHLWHCWRHLIMVVLRLN
jgi:L-fucose isomerase-like protein